MFIYGRTKIVVVFSPEMVVTKNDPKGPSIDYFMQGEGKGVG